MTDKIIEHDNDTWVVIGIGIANGEGRTGLNETYVHLASTTRGSYWANGFHPVQIGTFVQSSILEGL